MDNIQSKETEHGGYQYAYDDLYRLTTVDNPIQDDEEFTYDEVGNRVTSAETTGNWSYNQNNELGGFDDTCYVYDDNGNMVQKTVAGVVTNYVYNTEDRLAEVRDGSGSLIAEYYYDPFGRRLWKEVSGVRTYFHYADEGLIGEYDGSGTEIKTYGYKPGSTWTTDPLFMKVGTNYYFYQNDHLGTPQKMTAVNGAVVWSAKYGSFGKAKVEVGATVQNNLRFPGQYEDGETGLYYNFLRYYITETGRYLRTDPMGMGGGINLFAYAFNRPISSIDPFGLYGINVHFGLTYHLARAAGICEGDALKIAHANQYVDENPDTEPIGTFIDNFGTGNLRQAMDNHFPIDPNAPDDAVVERNSDYVNSIMSDALSSGDLNRVGAALHTYQDSWSHEGFRNHHIWAGTSPDETSLSNRRRDMNMAVHTYAVMQMMMDLGIVKVCCGNANPFPETSVRSYFDNGTF